MLQDDELQSTHIVLFKSPRDVLQINTLSQQLGLGYWETQGETQRKQRLTSLYHRLKGRGLGK